MAKTLSDTDRDWYYAALEAIDGDAVVLNRAKGLLTYHGAIRSDESRTRSADPEELTHALLIALLNSSPYNYEKERLGHELHFAHGSKGSKSDEVDVLIWDEDDLPYAIVELKSARDFEREKYDAIQYQLFGTASLVGAPKLLIYATVKPSGSQPAITAVCIDYTKYKSFDAWRQDDEPHSTSIPFDYRDLCYEPFVNGGSNDLDLNSSSEVFRSIAATFHNEFFGEHPDNTLFGSLVKCLLAKIHDERTSKKGSEYDFQVFYRNQKPETAAQVFARVNGLYRQAYSRYVDPHASDIDELNSKEFSEENVKSVVQALQGISITKGAARHGDVIGTFFEEILRSGFKQDRGMYFTHDNLVRFMVEALDLRSLTRAVWKVSNHPDNKLPYVIDPACGSGTFLLHSMSCITESVKDDPAPFISDHDSESFYNARLSNDQPNYWAENFLYGLDPKYIMAITAKVNMVLHGDGSAHIFKDDAFRPFSSYADPRLRPCNEASRTVPRTVYAPGLCEQFDVVSNPPFGITLSAETKAINSTAFSLAPSTPSEGLFIERCFQLLKPAGRLAVVVPESLLNAKDMLDVRLLIYRFFHIRAVVSLPRNIFVDTPTLTSLLFAEKKDKDVIAQWDGAWKDHLAVFETAVANASLALRKRNVDGAPASAVAERFLSAFDGILDSSSWITKGGKAPEILPLQRDWTGKDGPEAAAYYRSILRTAGFRNLGTGFVFRKMVEDFDYNFPQFEVDEIGFKLSKRRERARVNQLCRFVQTPSGEEASNLHLLTGEYRVHTDTTSPARVLDFVRRDVKWSLPE